MGKTVWRKRESSGDSVCTLSWNIMKSVCPWCQLFLVCEQWHSTQSVLQPNRETVNLLYTLLISCVRAHRHTHTGTHSTFKSDHIAILSVSVCRNGDTSHRNYTTCLKTTTHIIWLNSFTNVNSPNKVWFSNSEILSIHCQSPLSMSVISIYLSILQSLPHLCLPLFPH